MGLATAPLVLLAGGFILLSTVVPLGWIVAAHGIAGSGKWASLPPAGLGIPLLTTVALLFAILAAQSGSSRDRESAPPGRWVAPFWAAMLLFTWAVLALLWSPSTAYGLDKTLRFGLFNLLPAYAVYSAVRSRSLPVSSVLFAFRWAALGISVLGIALTAASFTSNSETTRLSVGVTDPITFGTVAGLGVLLWAIGPTNSTGIAMIPLRFVAVVVCCAALIGSNSKGPVIATLLTLVVLAVREHSGRSVGRLLGVLLIGTTILYLAPSEYTSRFDPGIYFGQPNQAEVSESVYSRTRFSEDAIAQFMENPVIGAGTGAFNQIPWTEADVPQAVGGGTRSYPHNIVLEIAAEQGTVGLLLLLVLIGTVVATLRRRRLSAPVFAVTMLVAAGTVFSGDISDHRIFWLGLAMAAGEIALGRRAAPPDQRPSDRAAVPEPV